MVFVKLLSTKVAELNTELLMLAELLAELLNYLSNYE